MVMIPMLSKTKYLQKINICSLLYCLWHFRTINVIPFRNTWIRAEKGGRIKGEGTLFLGLQWELGRYMPSQMVLRADSTVHIKGKFKIYSGHSIWVNQNATLLLGSGYINNNLRLSCFKRIEIGHNVAISENVTIWDSDCHCVGRGANTAPIKIGDNVWIGLNSVILKGVTIGEGSVIGAGSVVTRNIPPHALAAGVPAVVKRRKCAVGGTLKALKSCGNMWNY